MDSKEAQTQIEQMISFIASEATDRANEIQKKGDEEFSIEVHRLITEQKEKVRQTYEKKVKQIETQYAIAKSMAINKQRLEKIKARQEVMGKVETEAETQLAGKSNDPKFITDLIVQGLLMLLEKEVQVRCREEDAKLVEKALTAAQEKYTKVIKDESGVTKDVKLTLDKQTWLNPAPKAGKTGPSCLGGVVLFCQNNTITVDNTVDARLKLVMEQAKPAIRGLLFPTN